MTNPEHTQTTAAVLAAARTLAAQTGALSFGAPVTHVYLPLDYAWAVHAAYIARYATGPRRVLFVGMNPGPFGMAQTGVPFGEIAAVRDWLGLSGAVGQPPQMHPQRPVQGFACPRQEVSGQRLWGLFRARFRTPEAFFAQHYVANYCPLLFLAETRNLTPDKLPVAARQPLLAACDRHLQALCTALAPDWVIGIGRWAEQRALAALAERSVRISSVLHPSPASPAANRGWAAAATAQLVALGVWPATSAADLPAS
ncbi:MAG: single-stranded DNA-binding protein [Chromatiaceae bacterium]|nr:MAG: single-stranded DNA-binding protein [Chromatiaceae bacterium]